MCLELRIQWWFKKMFSCSCRIWNWEQSNAFHTNREHYMIFSWVGCCQLVTLSAKRFHASKGDLFEEFRWHEYEFTHQKVINLVKCPNTAISRVLTLWMIQGLNIFSFEKRKLLLIIIFSRVLWFLNCVFHYDKEREF